MEYGQIRVFVIEDGLYYMPCRIDSSIGLSDSSSILRAAVLSVVGWKKERSSCTTDKRSFSITSSSSPGPLRIFRPISLYEAGSSSYLFLRNRKRQKEREREREREIGYVFFFCSFNCFFGERRAYTIFLFCDNKAQTHRIRRKQKKTRKRGNDQRSTKKS